MPLSTKFIPDISLLSNKCVTGHIVNSQKRSFKGFLNSHVKIFLKKNHFLEE